MAKTGSTRLMMQAALIPRKTVAKVSSPEGTFEYIEAKIRCDAEGTSFGGDFEWLCQWFLENSPRYRGQFDKVWRWKDWPERWGPEAGIDLVARTRAGELWAIQAKADHPDRTITKREIDSFLSESNRSQFAFRLLMATTDNIGVTARRTLDDQEKKVGRVLRGDFLTEEIQWPVQIGGTAAPLDRWNPRPHQATAIDAVVNGFRDHDRGRLIMACGTGKTLTALWIAERLQQRRLPKSQRLRKSVESSLTLVLVPSLSLVQQNLAEWGRHSTQDFDTLVVCSDESVVQRNEDTAFQSTADLGVQVTTDAEEIQHFLSQRRKRPAVVFATYQSSDRIAAAQADWVARPDHREGRGLGSSNTTPFDDSGTCHPVGKAKPFDLVICDESHRLAGHAEGLFATVLDGQKIKASKRLFMTATPRYFKEHVKRRAAELEFELVSMDDAHVFGPEFHVLTFHEAISAKPEPLLTDYQVVVIGVTDREAKAWAERATLVRTAEGLSTDARTLAAQIGLAKAMQKYDLRKLITFHSSVAKAARFVDATRRDSLPGVIAHMKSFVVPPSGGTKQQSPPKGGTTNLKLWTKHISGHTPAGQRATLLKGLGHLPEDTRGILSNCACLGEGVDVPVLDGVAFIDPKRSMVDIIQAVGRVIRKAVGKQLGTIVIPVFIDESEDADHVLSQSAFEPVWQVLKALRAHDRRLADELDQLRLSLGSWSKSRGIKLPKNIHLDVPQLLLRNFEQAFYVRTVEQTTDKPALTIEQILAWADACNAMTGEWPKMTSGQVIGTDETWARIDSSLRAGVRGLTGGSSLAKLLAKHRRVRNIMDLPPLTIKRILAWMDAHKAATGDWPNENSGLLIGTDETWARINYSLVWGRRGLSGRSSLAKLLAEHRDVRNIKNLSPLTIKQILSWIDAHKAATGDWPKKNSGQVTGTDETWSTIDGSLRAGLRGLADGSSLTKLLAKYRGVRNVRNLPSLTIKQILAWVDAHKLAIDDWPNQESGPVTGTDEKWSGIDAALRAGNRSLPGGSSLARLLAERRGVRNRADVAELAIEQILEWADAHKTETGDWPNANSGQVTGTEETWAKIDRALRAGVRGLSGGSSLIKLLSQHRNARNSRGLLPLTIPQILKWVDEHKATTGDWPKSNSGIVTGADETWAGIDSSLKGGRRGLPAGSSLANLLAIHRKVRNIQALPPLTVEQILVWADAHNEATGEWPNQKSGKVPDTDETWERIDRSLRRGLRGLVGKSSLPKLLSVYRNVRNSKTLPLLTIPQILVWANAHKKATGNWPHTNSGPVPGADETWAGIQTALNRGRRGLAGGTSLRQLLDQRRLHSTS